MVSQVRSAGQAALLAQPQYARVTVPERGMQRRLAPQLVEEEHSQLDEVQVLPVEHCAAEAHISPKQLPVVLSQRLAPQAAAGLRRQSGVQTPRESSVVTDWQT